MITTTELVEGEDEKREEAQFKSRRNGTSDHCFDMTFSTNSLPICDRVKLEGKGESTGSVYVHCSRKKCDSH